MADIELVIKIPEDTYYRIRALARYDYFEHDICDDSMQRIANGTPLPQGHGDLIDRDEFHQTLENILIRDNDKWFNWLQKACLRLAEAPTIIEADKGE